MSGKKHGSSFEKPKSDPDCPFSCMSTRWKEEGLFVSAVASLRQEKKSPKNQQIERDQRGNRSNSVVDSYTQALIAFFLTHPKALIEGLSLTLRALLVFRNLSKCPQSRQQYGHPLGLFSFIFSQPFNPQVQKVSEYFSTFFIMRFL